MVNLTIRLGKAGGARSPGGGGKPESATPGGNNLSVSGAASKGPSVAPHLVDTDLPLLRGVGTVFPEPCAVSFVGVKARRRPGDKVHICVRCNFPIAVYGRLIPCEHVFCLTCAKLDPTCFLCEERVTRIQKMDVLEGIYICGAPGCLRSFLARPDFDNHVTDAHSQLLLPEQGRLSPERNVSTGNPVPEAQAQSHQGGQQYADLGPPIRQSSSTLQVILPKKEEPPQRRPPKGARQDPQGLLARPVPELRLPDQFPHHRGSDHQHMNQSNHDVGNDVDPQGRDRKPRGNHSEWDTHGPQQGQGLEREREQMREGDPRRERWGDERGSGRVKERNGDKGPDTPSSLPTPKDLSQQNQQPASLPPPPNYPPPNFSPAYLPQQEGNSSFPARFDASRTFYPAMPFNQNGAYGQSGGPPRPMNGQASQDQLGYNRSVRPHFYPEYGPGPGMGMPPMGGPRYQEGHLPPPPGPPPKRAKFNGPQGSGEPMMEPYSWGPGNPANFGGPPGGGHATFGGPPNWMPPANS